MSNSLATGRRTYLHADKALDLAIRAAEALGLVFWALAPGTDIWATDYSQNVFRISVAPARNGARRVSTTGLDGKRMHASVVADARRTVAQADEWTLFSTENENVTGDIVAAAPVAQETETVAATSDVAHTVTIGREPVLGSDATVYVAHCACGAEFDAHQWNDADTWATAHERAATEAEIEAFVSASEAAILSGAQGVKAERARVARIQSSVVDSEGAPVYPASVEAIATNTVTITFRAKLDDFAGGKGYKVPALTHSHVSVAKRDTLGVTFLGALGNQDITRARLAKFAGITLPGVVFANDPGAWTVTPIGKGFMADVSITARFERTAPAAPSVEAIEAPAAAPVADDNEHVEINAVITDRDGNRTTVYAGSLPRWAWEADRAPEWRKAKRAVVLADITSDARGYRVDFAPAQDIAAAAPVAHTVTVEKVAMSSGPGWRAACTCGHVSAPYFAAHAAQTMADAHAKENAPTTRDAIEARAVAQGWTLEDSIVGNSQRELTRAGVSISLEYTASGAVSTASAYGQAFGTFGYSDRLAELGAADKGKRATVLRWLDAPVGATRAESRDLFRDHVTGETAQDIAVAPAPVVRHGADMRVVSLEGGEFGAGATGVVLDGNESGGSTITVRWDNGDGTMIVNAADFATVIAAPVVRALDPAIEQELADLGGAMNAAYTALGTLAGESSEYDAALDTYNAARSAYHLASSAASKGYGDAVRAAREVTAPAPTANLAKETEAEARRRWVRRETSPGIAMATCYRCGANAGQTVALPITSRTTVCTAHLAEAEAVAARWQEAIDYLDANKHPALGRSTIARGTFTRVATDYLGAPLPVIAAVLTSEDYAALDFAGQDRFIVQMVESFLAARYGAISARVF